MTNGEKIKQIFPDAEITIVKSNYGRTKVAVDWKFEQIPSYYNLFYEEWWNAEYKEPTTKNNLGVDCISRDAVKYYIQAHIHEIITESGLDKNAHTNEVLRALLNGVATMPSVTPQKPRKGEWLRMSDLSEQDDDRYKCSRCGNVIHHKNKMDLYTFNSWCGRCGSDNGRHVNYEVEE